MPTHPFVSRGGIKLAAALDAFQLDVTGLTCADLGASVGGFTDCLLQRGAAKVYAVDTAYGQFAWKLRNDPRVCLLERTNALHVTPAAQVDLVVIDLGWTKQSHAIPAALRWLQSPLPQKGEGGGGGRIISLIKPHYEADKSLLRKGVLPEADAQRVCEQVLAAMPSLGVTMLGYIPSPIPGGGSRTGGGNVEYLALLRPA